MLILVRSLFQSNRHFNYENINPKQNNLTCTREITLHAQEKMTDQKHSIVLAPTPNHEDYNGREVSFIMQETLKTSLTNTTCNSKTWGLNPCTKSNNNKITMKE